MDLNNIRNQIDSLDAELVELFLKRMNLCKEVAQYKKEHGLPIFVPAREEAVLSRVEALSGEEMSPYTQELFRKIMELSKQYQFTVMCKEVK